MDDEILKMFQEDTKEGLADIESDLLDIEEAGPSFDPELVNKVFRAAHSIKGSASFLGLGTIRDLAHKIENVLDMVRNKEILPEPNVINVVLTAFDTLGTMVTNVHQSDQMDVSDQIRNLTSLVSDGLPPERKQSLATSKMISLPDGRTVFEVSEHYLFQARRGGNYLYLVEYDLIHDVQYKDKTPFDLLGFLEKSGLILDCKLDVQAVGDLDHPVGKRIPLFVLYASILEPDMVKAVLQVEQQFIHHISLDEERAAAAVREGDKEFLWKPAPVPDAALEDMERQFDNALKKLGNKEQPGEAEVSDKPAREPAPESAAGVPDSIREVEGFPLQGAGTQGRLVLGGALNIERVTALRAALIEALNLYTRVVLELQGIKDMDLACFQLLVSAFQTGKAKGVSVTCQGDSLGVLRDLARRVGVTGENVTLHGLEPLLPSA